MTKNCWECLPRCYEINSHSIESPQIAHQSPDSKLGHIILWSAKQVEIASETGFENQALITIGVICLLAEIMHSQLGGIHDTNEVDIDDFQVRFLGFIWVIFAGRQIFASHTHDNLEHLTLFEDWIITCNASIGDYDINTLMWRICDCSLENSKLILPRGDIAFHELIATVNECEWQDPQKPGRSTLTDLNQLRQNLY